MTLTSNLFCRSEEAVASLTLSSSTAVIASTIWSISLQVQYIHYRTGPSPCICRKGSRLICRELGPLNSSLSQSATLCDLTNQAQEATFKSVVNGWGKLCHPDLQKKNHYPIQICGICCERWASHLLNIIFLERAFYGILARPIRFFWIKYV